MIKVGLFAICALLLAILLHREKSEYAMIISYRAGTFIFLYGLSEVYAVKAGIQEIVAAVPFDTSFLKTLLKMIGVAYVGEFVENICKDNGYSAIAAPIDLFSRLTILVMGLPLIKYVIQIVGQFL